MKKVFVMVMASLAMLFVFATDVSARTEFSETITVAQNQAWNNRRTNITRNMNNDFVRARVRAVFPVTGGVDNFTQLQVRVTDVNGTRISQNASTVLNEQNATPIVLRIDNRFRGVNPVRFSFRGNNPAHAAEAVVWYGR